MQIRQFLEWAGVDYEAVWPEDRSTRLRNEIAPLKRDIELLRARLIARKRRILAIRSCIESIERSGESQRLDRLQCTLNSAEDRYKYWLARWNRANRRLARLRRNLLDALADKRVGLIAGREQT